MGDRVVDFIQRWILGPLRRLVYAMGYRPKYSDVLYSPSAELVIGFQEGFNEASRLQQASVNSEKAIQASLRYVKGVYKLHRAPNAPDWEETEARVEKYLRHVFRAMEDVER